MKKDTLLKIALFTCGFGSFSDGIVIPLTNIIIQSYPDTSLFMRNMFLSGSSLTALAGAILCGIFINKLNKKHLLLFGSILFLIGGVGGAFAPNMEALVFTRLIDGFSDGVLSVAAMSTITLLYNDENERSSVMGGYNATSALYGLITSSLSGILAVYSYRYAFFLNAVTIIGIILLLICLPDMPKLSTKEDKVKTNSSDNQAKLYFILLLYFISATLINQTYYLADVFLSEKSIGSSVITGTLLTVLTIANLTASTIFSRLYKKLHNVFLEFVFILSAVSLFIMYCTHEYWLLGISFALAGASNSLGGIYFSMYISNNAKAENVGWFMALYTVAMYLSGFASPYMPSLFGGIFGISSIAMTYFISCVVCVLISISSCVIKKKLNR